MSLRWIIHPMAVYGDIHNAVNPALQKSNPPRDLDHAAQWTSGKNVLTMEILNQIPTRCMALISQIPITCHMFYH